MIEHYIHSGHSKLFVDFVYEEKNYRSLAVEAFECEELVVFYRNVRLIVKRIIFRQHGNTVDKICGN